MSRPLIKPDFGLEVCALCERDLPLRRSHIIPSFVFEWLKETSGTGHIRAAENINLRVQDGWKTKLLCSECEQRFSQWEKIFAEQVFAPLHRREADKFRYGVWMEKFAVSVSWRVLTVYKLIDGLAGFPQTVAEAANAALFRWKHFLLDIKTDPGIYEQHMFPVDFLESTTVPEMPPNMNRYLARAIEIHVVHGGNIDIVYSKMGRIILFGFIQMPNPRAWQGTKLNVNYGNLGSDNYKIPSSIIEFLMDRARGIATSQAKMSTRQKEVLNNAICANPELMAQSESFLAMQQDVEMFGKAAFAPNNEE
jgi:hypothetical protein